MPMCSFGVAICAFTIYHWAMSMAEIKDTIANWPAERRGQLAVWLLNSLPPHGPQDALSDSIDEATRRREQLDSGEVEALSSEQFWNSIREV